MCCFIMLQGLLITSRPFSFGEAVLGASSSCYIPFLLKTGTASQLLLLMRVSRSLLCIERALLSSSLCLNKGGEQHPCEVCSAALQNLHGELLEAKR